MLASQSTLYNITKSVKNKDKSLSTYYQELKSLQQELLGASLDKPNQKFDATACNATFSMMSSFTPMFTQFLAWQRLMQIENNSINFSATQATTPVVASAAVPTENVTVLKQKRQFKQQEVSEDVEPPNKRKKLTLADCIDNLMTKKQAKEEEVKLEKTYSVPAEVQKDNSLEKATTGGASNDFELQFAEDNDLLRQEEVTPQQQYLQITENEPLESDPDVEASPVSPCPNNIFRDDTPQFNLPPTYLLTEKPPTASPFARVTTLERSNNMANSFDSQTSDDSVLGERLTSSGNNFSFFGFGVDNEAPTKGPGGSLVEAKYEKSLIANEKLEDSSDTAMETESVNSIQPNNQPKEAVPSTSTSIDTTPVKLPETPLVIKSTPPPKLSPLAPIKSKIEPIESPLKKETKDKILTPIISKVESAKKPVTTKSPTILQKATVDKRAEEKKPEPKSKPVTKSPLLPRADEKRVVTPPTPKAAPVKKAGTTPPSKAEQAAPKKESPLAKPFTPSFKMPERAPPVPPPAARKIETPVKPAISQELSKLESSILPLATNPPTTEKVTPNTTIMISVAAPMHGIADHLVTVGTVSQLPATIGRADPKTGVKDKLKLNLQTIYPGPLVKRVSHTHAELLLQGGKIVLLCHGRNGLSLGQRVINKYETVQVGNGSCFTIGIFELTIKLV